MIDAALTFIDPFDRDDWVMCAMSIKSELGDGGMDMWLAWSAQADNYKERDAKAVWRSVKDHGGITIKSLYKLARDNGYVGEEQEPQARTRDYAKEQAERKADQQRRDRAAHKAAEMVQSAQYCQHQYLVNKGFSDAEGLVLDDFLLIPMRDMTTGRMNSVQRIDRYGEKKFLSGGRARGSIFSMGAGREVYLVEGYATGLSVKAAIASLFREARVVVCFSASNMAYVAQSMGNFVIADHDESRTGEKYAVKTGLPWWMPPEQGDANDFARLHGIRALAEALRELRNKNGQGVNLTV